MSTDSRTGFNVRHLRNGGSEKGKSGTTGDRRRLLHECARHLDDADMKRQASRNASIVSDDAKGNVAWVNDGSGGLTETGNLESIISYGDDRASHVFRKMHENTFETSTFISFLPKSLCREIPEYYPREGKKPPRSRWVATDAAEMQRYFDHVVDFLSTHVLNGGKDAIHGVVLNLDESTPHIHVMADTFAPDPKHEGKLRTEAQQMWGSHRDVTGVNDEGKRVQLTGATKMRRYQSGMREYMEALGYDVEAVPDPTATGAGKREYVGLQEAKAEHDQREAELAERESELQEAEALLPKLKAKAEVEAKTITSEATSHASALVDAAKTQAVQIQQQAERRARETRLKADREAAEATKRGYEAGFSAGSETGRQAAYNAVHGAYKSFIRASMPTKPAEVREFVESSLNESELDSPPWQKKALQKAGIYDSARKAEYRRKEKHLLKMGLPATEQAVNEALERSQRDFLSDSSRKVDLNPSKPQNALQRSQEAQPDL